MKRRGKMRPEKRKTEELSVPGFRECREASMLVGEAYVVKLGSRQRDGSRRGLLGYDLYLGHGVMISQLHGNEA